MARLVDDRAWRSLLLVQRLSRDLSAIGVQVLGPAATDNRTIQLLALLLDGPMESGAVASALDITTPTAYRLVRELAAEGMLTRTPDRHDRRRLRIAASSTAGRRLARFESVMAQYCSEHLELLVQITDNLPSEASSTTTPPPRPILVMASMGTSGAAYLQAVEPILARYRLGDSAMRYALCMIAAIGPVRPRMLSEELAMTTGGVTALLNRLEAAGHISRRHDATLPDRRGVLVEATRHGLRAAEQVLDVFLDCGPDFARTVGMARSLGAASRKADRRTAGAPATLAVTGAPRSHESGL